MLKVKLARDYSSQQSVGPYLLTPAFVIHGHLCGVLIPEHTQVNLVSPKASHWSCFPGHRTFISAQPHHNHGGLWEGEKAQALFTTASSK